MAQKMYEYAVLYHPIPTKDQDERGEEPKSVIVVTPTTILAKDDKIAALLAARSIPEEYTDKLDQVEICIRPF